MDKKGLLTTADNPFDPYTQWKEWLAYDKNNNYNTCELIASVAHISSSDNDIEFENKLNQAIETILDFSPYHLMVYPKLIDGGEGSN
jgi:hypothetical protein